MKVIARVALLLLTVAGVLSQAPAPAPRAAGPAAAPLARGPAPLARGPAPVSSNLTNAPAPAFAAAPHAAAPSPAGAQCVPLVAAAQNNGFSSFLAVFEASGLTTNDLEELAGSTFFIPTNAAFAALLRANGLTSATDVPPKVLQDLILAHVIPGVEIFAKNITAKPATEKTRLSEADLKGCPANITAQLGSNNTVDITTAAANATVVAANITVCEGVAHAVSAVLVPCNLTTLFTESAAQAPLAEAPKAPTPSSSTTTVVGGTPTGAATKAPSPSSGNAAQSPRSAPAPSAAGSLAASAVAVIGAAVAAFTLL